MSIVQCVWIEPTGKGRLELRRFTWSKGTDNALTCEGGYHNAATITDEVVDVVRTKEGYIRDTTKVSHRDRRWPKTCNGCGRAFVASDQWQVNIREEWVRPDTGEAVCYGLRDVPPGSMYNAFWWRSGDIVTYPDGINLMVQLPDGMPWNVDGPTSDSRGRGTERRGWARTGDPKAIPPTVSASPSILTPGYHGFLTDGQLRSV